MIPQSFVIVVPGVCDVELTYVNGAFQLNTSDWAVDASCNREDPGELVDAAATEDTKGLVFVV